MTKIPRHKKVSQKQLEAIIKLMVTEASVDQLEESEIHNVLNFLKEFKLDDYRIQPMTKKPNASL